MQIAIALSARATAKSQTQYVRGPKLGTLTLFRHPAYACGMASRRKKVNVPNFAPVTPDFAVALRFQLLRRASARLPEGAVPGAGTQLGH